MSKIRELNLVPQHIKKEKENKEKMSQIIAGAVLVCCAIGGYAVYLNTKVSSLEKKKIELQGELQKTQERFDENTALNLRISEITASIDKIESLSVLKDRDTKRVMAELGKKMPSGLKVKNINYVTVDQDVKDGYVGAITLAGESKNRSDIEEFWANLREDKRYYISHISGITKSEDKESGVATYSFNLTLKIKEI
ncbi:MAG: PilN domain-containing protein [Clostridium sp.]|uniref:PilN domain-containing protein n=1 Tax=Clostridium sp. TaxID=1506 RepID=UPI003F2AB41B